MIDSFCTLALILAFAPMGFMALKALHRIEEQIDRLVRDSEKRRFDLAAEKGSYRTGNDAGDGDSF